MQVVALLQKSALGPHLGTFLLMVGRKAISIVLRVIACLHCMQDMVLCCLLSPRASSTELLWHMPGSESHRSGVLLDQTKPREQLTQDLVTRGSQLSAISEQLSVSQEVL